MWPLLLLAFAADIVDGERPALYGEAVVLDHLDGVRWELGVAEEKLLDASLSADDVARLWGNPSVRSNVKAILSHCAAMLRLLDARGDKTKKKTDEPRDWGIY